MNRKPLKQDKYETCYNEISRLAESFTNAFSKSVSVIVPTYNCRDFLARSLDGLKLQTYPSHLIEVIIADDGSSDGLISFIKNYKSPWKLVIVSQEDKGFRIASIRNKAILKAQGDIIVNLDADMFPLPEFLSEHLKIFHVSDEVIGIGPRRFVDMRHITHPIALSDLANIKKLPDVLSSSNWFLPKDRRLSEFEHFQKHPMPFHLFHGCNVSYRKKDALDVGLYSEDFDGHWGWEDVEFAYRLWKNDMIFLYIPRAAAFHQESQLNSHEQKVKDDQINFELACDKIQGLRRFKKRINITNRKPWWA